MTLKFKDGVEINTDGEFRKLELDDGWYVVGKGYLLPVTTENMADSVVLGCQEMSYKGKDK